MSKISFYESPYTLTGCIEYIQAYRKYLRIYIEGYGFFGTGKPNNIEVLISLKWWYGKINNITYLCD
jgi:hypothetical protein